MRNPDRAPELARIAARDNLPIMVSPMDVDADASVSESIGRIVKEIGPVDVLVNNAGIERTCSVEELPLAEFRAVMETNYFGVDSLRPSPHARNETTAERLHHQRGVDRRAHRLVAFWPLRGLEIRIGGPLRCLAQEVKPFNIRVAIVEPGIIDTPMARHICIAQGPSHYPHQRRIAALFTTSLKNPAPPLPGGRESARDRRWRTWQLRHPVGPDAAPFLDWRQKMSDEAWVDFGALDDDAWYERVRADFGMDARERRRGAG